MEFPALIAVIMDTRNFRKVAVQTPVIKKVATWDPSNVKSEKQGERASSEPSG